MTILPWSVLYHYVAPWLPGCPNVVMDDALRTAAIEYCEKTRAHKVYLTAIDSVVGVDAYVYTSPDPVNLNVYRADSVFFNGRQLDPCGLDERDILYPNWMTTPAVPEKYSQLNERAISIVPSPNVAITGAIVVRAAMTPTTTAVGLDDTLAEFHGRFIAQGALFTAMSMEGKEWNNDAKAGAYKAMFDDSISTQKIRAVMGFTRAAKRVRGSYF